MSRRSNQFLITKRANKFWLFSATLSLAFTGFLATSMKVQASNQLTQQPLETNNHILNFTTALSSGISSTNSDKSSAADSSATSSANSSLADSSATSSVNSSSADSSTTSSANSSSADSSVTSSATSSSATSDAKVDHGVVYLEEDGTVVATISKQEFNHPALDVHGFPIYAGQYHASYWHSDTQDYGISTDDNITFDYHIPVISLAEYNKEYDSITTTYNYIDQATGQQVGSWDYVYIQIVYNDFQNIPTGYQLANPQ